MKLCFFNRWDLREEKKKYGHYLTEEELQKLNSSAIDASVPIEEELCEEKTI